MEAGRETITILTDIYKRLVLWSQGRRRRHLRHDRSGQTLCPYAIVEMAVIPR
jgi:hypothetical protein